MPSGKTHDRITLWSLPFVAGLGFGLTKSGNLTLLLAGGFLFSGLMFGPDLDIHSRQFIRWGWLRWIWIPYQKAFRHRSIFSHGPIIGTVLRALYLTIFLAILGLIVLLLAQTVGSLQSTWQTFTDIGKRSTLYPDEWLALFVGLELGAMSHSVSDWTGSAYKRFKRRGAVGVLPPSGKKKPKKARRKKKTVKTKRTQR